MHSLKNEICIKPLRVRSDDETDLCGKVGLGLNFFAFQDISLGIEGNYIFGFDDLVDIMYFNFTIGAAYHF